MSHPNIHASLKSLKNNPSVDVRSHQNNCDSTEEPLERVKKTFLLELCFRLVLALTVKNIGEIFNLLPGEPKESFIATFNLYFGKESTIIAEV